MEKVNTDILKMILNKTQSRYIDASLGVVCSYLS